MIEAIIGLISSGVCCCCGLLAMVFILAMLWIVFGKGNAADDASADTEASVVPPRAPAVGVPPPTPDELEVRAPPRVEVRLGSPPPRSRGSAAQPPPRIRAAEIDRPGAMLEELALPQDNDAIEAADADDVDMLDEPAELAAEEAAQRDTLPRLIRVIITKKEKE